VSFGTSLFAARLGRRASSVCSFPPLRCLFASFGVWFSLSVAATGRALDLLPRVPAYPGLFFCSLYTWSREHLQSGLCFYAPFSLALSPAWVPRC